MGRVGESLAVVTMSQLSRSRTALHGREREARELAAFLGELQERSVSLIVHGPAGQGKSSLLDLVDAEARERGLAVVRTVGIEFERELAFSGLTAVLRPFLGELGRLSEAQRRAIEVAIGIAPGEAPVLTTYAAALTLMSFAAAGAGLVVIVDDAQWVDGGSLEALLFAAHRAAADRVGFLFAQRAGLPCLLDHTGFARIELGGLGREAARGLLAGLDVTPGVADRCWELTRGNPLAMIEGARGLTPRQRTGEEALPPALSVPARLLDTFQDRLAQLPDATLRALALAALEATDDADRIVLALRTTGGSVEDFDPAERQQLVSLSGGRVTWWHPLLRSAAYQHATGAWRREAHKALAAAAQAAGHDEQALWHLSEIVGPDDDVARRMAALGVAARRRGALMSAVAAHEQASRLATDPDESNRQLIEAADACWAAGDITGTRTLLEDRMGSAANDVFRARMAAVLGQAEMWTVGTAAGIERFEIHAASVAGRDPVLATYLLLHAATARLLALEPWVAVDTARRALALVEPTGDTAGLFGGTAMATLCEIFAGTDPSVVERLGPLRQLLVAALGAGAEGADDLTQLCSFALVVCERWSEAGDLIDLVDRSGETLGMMGRSAMARLLRAETWWRTGRWADALADLSQSLSLQSSVRPGQVVPGTLAMLARIEAGLGQEESCRAHAAEVLDLLPHMAMFTAIAHSAVGLLELGAGRFDQAALAFDEVEARAGGLGEPGWLWWQGDALDAYAGCGRTRDARRVLDRLADQVETTGRGWARAVVARGRGTLGQDPEAEDDLTTAIEAFRLLPAPFEEARTLLTRGRRRLEAGDHQAGARDIAAARTVFDRLGARTWSEHASVLSDAGPAPESALTTRLSPAELRVALLVGRGASNQQAADELFISAKTVDYHLSNVYRKLRLRNRAQLMAIVLTQAAAAG